MKIIDTNINDVKILIPDVYGDSRGYFYESYNDKWFKENIANITFVQDNQSKSSAGVLRGLHFQRPPYSQAKLVRCVQGKVFDVAVDIRKGSPTYGKYAFDILTPENHHQLFMPEGFAHGFVALEDNTIFQYKCNNFYNKESEGGIAYNDKDLHIEWPEMEYELSAKDTNHITLKELNNPFIYEYINNRK